MNLLSGLLKNRITFEYFFLEHIHYPQPDATARYVTYVSDSAFAGANKIESQKAILFYFDLV